jgi:hypothetical protein
MKFLIALLLTMTFSNHVLACSEDGSTGFFPENDLYIPEGAKLVGGLTEEQFRSIIREIEIIYDPIVTSMGGNLKIVRRWKEGMVNASATRIGGWNVNMYGGLARHPAITEDGFALVLCHEIGHHLGGAPKVTNFLKKWASNEGQADYFGALKCLRKSFLNDNNTRIVRKMDPPASLVKACNKAWFHVEDKSICIRTGMAGISVSNLFAIISRKPNAKFDTPDVNVVSRTDDSHPALQCRLDTFFQAALCDKSFNEDVSQTDEVSGTCHESIGDKIGLRPRCWFKPKS